MKKNFMVGLITILVIIASCAFAYSKWSIKTEQTESNVFGSSCLSTTITESDEISLKNTFPMTDEDGLKLTPYTFTLTNECDISEVVQIDLELFNNTLSSSQVKYSFNNSTPAKVVSLTTVTELLNGATSAYKLYTDTLAGGQSKTYSLKLWVNEEETTETAQSKTFDSKISIVTSYGK